MTTVDPLQTTEPTDAHLVTKSLAGSRDAFRQIVERYQTLVCSLAYSATGNVSQSEDVAQETFLAAWKNLRSLREPEKLRAWLCGIVRHRVHRSFRKEIHQPVRNAAPLEDAHDVPALEALPSEETISREEEAILWRSLEKIPELYREPLVLFYREHQSIERVAAVLELTEDAVKQRLSRGRKLLREEVQAFVEGMFNRTSPKRAFSAAVLAAMPAAPAGAAGAGAAGKSGFLGLAALPFFGAFAGFLAQKMTLDATVTDRVTRASMMKRLAWSWVILLGAAVGGEYSTHALAQQLGWSERVHFAAIALFWWFYATVVVTCIIVVLRRLPLEAAEVTGAKQVLPAGAQAGIIAGVYLSLSSWIVPLAVSHGDWPSVAGLGIVLTALGAWHFFHARRATGAASASANLGHVALAVAAVLVVFNLRFPDWLASDHGVSIAEVRQLRPMWLISSLTLVFACWIALMWQFTRPGRRG